MDLPKVETQPKSGRETFEFQNNELDFELLDFWKWNQSDLLENRTRGILAEFIVMKALDIDSKNRIEWADYDLITKTGKTIEIKSAAYIQTWEQQKKSTIRFNINETKQDYTNPNYNGIKSRWSDYYIFCLLTEKDQSKVNPMDLSQWNFYVLETEILNIKLKSQKTIGLNSLLKLNPTFCNYKELKEVIK